MWFLKMIHNIVRGLVRLVFQIPVLLIQALIYLITFEPGTKKRVTVRKARRIRLLTKVKMGFFNMLPTPVSEYLGVEEYKKYLNSHLSHGLQLRDEGTDRRAV